MWAALWELHLLESCFKRNSSIIETFKLSQCKKSSLYICASWNFKHQGLHYNWPNTVLLSVMMSKNYPVNLSNFNFTDSGHQNSITFLQVNSLCRKILHQIVWAGAAPSYEALLGQVALHLTCSHAPLAHWPVSELKDLSDGSTLFLRQSCAGTSYAIREELLDNAEINAHRMSSGSVN